MKMIKYRTVHFQLINIGEKKKKRNAHSMINSEVFIYLLYRVLINNTTQCSIWTIKEPNAELIGFLNLH